MAFYVCQLVTSTVAGDAVEMVILMTSMCVGWLAWAAATQCFERLGRCRTMLVGKSSELAVPAREPAVANEASAYAAGTGSFSSPFCSMEDNTAAHQLFEHYSLFGAPSGTWSLASEPASSVVTPRWPWRCDGKPRSLAQNEIQSVVSSGQSDASTDVLSDSETLLDDLVLDEWQESDAAQQPEQEFAIVTERQRIAEISERPSPINSTSVIFEAYDLFGAAPGTWNPSITCPGQERQFVEDSVPADILPRSVTEVASTLVLFEHYELFGASAGMWSAK